MYQASLLGLALLLGLGTYHRCFNLELVHSRKGLPGRGLLEAPREGSE